MASHDQRRQSYRAGDQAKGQVQELSGQTMGSVENRARGEGDPIYDAIQEAKEVVKQKGTEAAAQKAQRTAQYGKDETS